MPETVSFPSSAQTDYLKVPPHSVEAEQAVIGGLLLDNRAWEDIGDRVSEKDFYRGDHQLIFNAIRSLEEKSQPFDAVTLSEWLEKNGQLEDVGGMAYIGRLAKETPTAANIVAYADIVRERSVLRQLIAVGTDIAGSGFNTEGRGSRELVEMAEKRIYEIAEEDMRGRGGFRDIKELLTKTVEEIDYLFQAEGNITGVPTGFDKFDDSTTGLHAGELIIIAGRPSMGKTTFAMNIAENAAIGHKTPVAVFSMEMPGEQLAMRMISSLGRIDQHHVRTGQLTDEDWPRITSAVHMLSEAKLFIDDTPALSPGEVRARARRIKRKHGLGLVVLDYLQLMGVPGGGENRATEISEISRGLKAMAKELNVPVIALSQLNRSLEQRNDKRPIMSDLRESGAIEQDADLIVFIYRDEVYNEDSPDKGMAEIIIAKQRNGPIGKSVLTFLGKYTKFENYIPEMYANDA
ncbi:MAG: replicative DNA helicase [Gammaproteobacteria bacterium]|nr:replicative DNA helicase [Gammaproteobacteria bacterium]NNJ97005.1 replicative DNA helicase [Gammaproteobacteria bacterium]